VGDGAGICDPTGDLVPESARAERAKNRLHLDVKVSSGWHVEDDRRAQRINAKVAELVAASAAVHERHVVHGHLDHVVMLDPEGNDSCVV
jgi:hypothetical protein